MYFYGKLSVDPSSLTHVGIVEPTKAFAKILRFMTAGLASAKEERETFTAVSILQQFNRVFMSLGISNIVRIAKDGEDFYLDTEGRENDLKEAMEAFAKKASGSSSQKPFESLSKETQDSLFLEAKKNKLS